MRQVLFEFADVLEGRVVDAAVPAWCERRGWTEALLSLSDAELLRAELVGLRASEPENLVAFCARTEALAAPYRGTTTAPASVQRGVKLRKSAQIEALLAECRAAKPPQRIVDFGAGLGHLTRALASELDVEAVGVECDPVRVAAAERLGGARFRVADAAEVALAAGDLVVGLHACGALGDTLVERAAAHGADVLLVSCCPHKTTAAERRSISREGAGLGLSRIALGAANIAHLQRVEDMDRVMSGRRERFALRRLLERRDVHEPAGHELYGVPRRRVGKGLAACAEIAFRRRGLAPPSAAELSWAEREAAREHGRVRRLNLPRYRLARMAELFIVFDRAAYLSERGYQVSVRALFPFDVSSRNVAIFAGAPM
ncbi:MAG: methyltransferase [Polyangiaceae bacterium]|nr:methyltransferase [Polyangiaceae bacterium]